MSPEEFTSGPGSTGLLTETQFRGILKGIANDKSKFPGGFKLDTREIYGEISFIRERHKYEAGYIVRRITNCGIFIKVDTDIEIREIEFLSKIGKSEKIEKITLRITDCENRDRFHWKIIETTKFESRVRTSTFLLGFENLIKLERAKRYSLNVEIHDPDEYPTLDILNWDLQTDGVSFKFFQYPNYSSVFPLSRIIFNKMS